ncbi:hypothetical protein HanRHA438_Chr09g0407411 [Helianthus annuus]|nr:hypothetical protein HanRHA438_Chr09g0407411 [Helianthus annuus]
MGIACYTLLIFGTIDLSIESRSFNRFRLRLSAIKFLEGCPSTFLDLLFFSLLDPMLKTVGIWS